MANTERFIDYHQCLLLVKLSTTIYNGNAIGLYLCINHIKQSIIDSKQNSKITECVEPLRYQELYKVFIYLQLELLHIMRRLISQNISLNGNVYIISD